MFKKILNVIIAHKIITGMVVVILAIGGYFLFKTFSGSAQETRYVLSAVTKGTIIISVSGTGQVSASNQLDLKPKASGDVVYVGVKEGQSVKAKTLIVQLDSSAAQKSVRDAKANLESANLAMEKLEQPTDALTLLQAENSLAQAQQAKTSAQEDLQKAYDDGFNTVANAFLQLPDIISGLNSVLYDSTISSNQWNIDYYANSLKQNQAAIFEYKETTATSYQLARTQYDKNFSDYKAANRNSDTATIEALINETYDTTKSLADAIKNANNFIQFYKDAMKVNNLTPVAMADTHLSTLNGYTSQTNTHLLNLLSIKNTIENSKTTIINADSTIAEKEKSLEELRAGTDAIDLQSQQLTVKQRQNALYDAQQTLADYYVYAPFDGIVASVDVKKGDSASSGSVVATLITASKIAEVSLNEVDVANIKVGQKATLTFDAIDGLSITGEVAQVDTIGTVSSGVVSYDVKINFDTQDDRIKSGMSVTAAIITETRQDVLEVPSSAIKTSNDVSYVLQLGSQYTDTSSTGVVSAEAPTQTQVVTGLSDDTYTEITSGLKEGDLIVVKTIKSSTTSSGSKTNTNKSSGSSSILGGGMPPR
jgi:HlyD family secretion protein